MRPNRHSKKNEKKKSNTFIAFIKHNESRRSHRIEKKEKKIDEMMNRSNGTPHSHLYYHQVHAINSFHITTTFQT